MTETIQTDNRVLKGIASTLNGFGRALVFSYDMGATGPKAVYNLAKKTTCSMTSLCRKANEKRAAQEGEKQARSIFKQELGHYKKEQRRAVRRHEKEYSHVINQLDQSIKESLSRMPASEFEAVEPLVLDLFDHEMEIKILAAAHLGETGNPVLGPVLVAALGFNDPALTDTVLTALHAMDADGIDQVLEALLESPYAKVRLAAVNHLDKMGAPERQQACLAGLLEDEQPEVRLAAVKHLDLDHAPGIENKIRPLIKDEFEGVRRTVISALARTKNPGVLPVLIQALDDRSAGIREQALMAIQAVSGRYPEFDPALKGKKRHQAMDDLARALSDLMASGADGAEAPAPADTSKPEPPPDAEDSSAEDPSAEDSGQKPPAAPRFSEADLKRKTKAQLMELGKEMGVMLLQKMTKDAMIRAIMSHRS